MKYLAAIVVIVVAVVVMAGLAYYVITTSHPGAPPPSVLNVSLRDAGSTSFTKALVVVSKVEVHKAKATNDTVWAFSPPALLASWTPAPLTYTQLYRDGYADGVGFLDEKFSRAAR